MKFDPSARPIVMICTWGNTWRVRFGVGDVGSFWRRVGHVQDEHGISWDMAWKTPKTVLSAVVLCPDYRSNLTSR
jgi:hypothetical protein